jgi:hypothetical protein
MVTVDPEGWKSPPATVGAEGVMMYVLSNIADEATPLVIFARQPTARIRKGGVMESIKTSKLYLVEPAPH